MILSKWLDFYTILFQGLLDNDYINSFNLPLYTPCIDEVKDIVQHEGSFTVDRLETHEVNWDTSDDKAKSVYDINNSGKIVAKAVRAIVEPMLATHFQTGNSFMDKLFERYALHVADHLSREKIKGFYILISLTRKNVYV